MSSRQQNLFELLEIAFPEAVISTFFPCTWQDSPCRRRITVQVRILCIFAERETCRRLGRYSPSDRLAPGASEDHPLLDDVRELVHRCLAGEQAAMVELVERFRGQVFGLCYRMLGHRQDAEDVTQESFLRALRSLGNWDGERELTPWLLAIAGNRCRTMLAMRSRRPVVSPLVDQMPDKPLGLEDEQSLAEEVALAMNGLRAEYRRAFLLFHEQQLSYQQISEALGCPLGTVKTWVHRARREIVDHLTERGVVERSASELAGHERTSACNVASLKTA